MSEVHRMRGFNTRSFTQARRQARDAFLGHNQGKKIPDEQIAEIKKGHDEFLKLNRQASRELSVRMPVLTPDGHKGIVTRIDEKRGAVTVSVLPFKREESYGAATLRKVVR